MKSIIYRKLYGEIIAAGESVHGIAYQIGMDPHTIYARLRGDHEWKLWECLEIKRVIHSNLTIEELFVKHERTGTVRPIRPAGP